MRENLENLHQIHKPIKNEINSLLAYILFLVKNIKARLFNK